MQVPPNRLPHQPVKADWLSIRACLFRVHGNNKGSATAQQGDDQRLDSGACLLDGVEAGMRGILGDAAGNVDATPEQWRLAHQRSSTTGEGLSCSAARSK